MSTCYYTVLEERGIVQIMGDEAREFLQSLVSNDIYKVKRNQAIYAALLTPQGKYLFDFFIMEHGGDLFLETERPRIADLIKRLSIYKLRAKVSFQDISDKWQVIVVWGKNIDRTLGLKLEVGAARRYGSGVAFIDPRLTKAGARILLSACDAPRQMLKLPVEAYDVHRLKLGLPDGSRDLVREKSILLENCFDDLNGIDWDKGCYMGQELTARTKYRGLIKKRLVPVVIDGPLPEPGTQITTGKKSVGEIRSGCENFALAMLRLETLINKGEKLQAGLSTIIPQKPEWATF